MELFALLIGLFVYYLIFRIVTYVIYDGKKPPRRSYIVAIGVPAFIILGETVPGYLELRNACLKDGGTHIFKTVTVNGYINESPNYSCINCWRHLINQQYEYLEFNITQAQSYKVFNKNGLYRMKSISRPENDKLCEKVDAKVKRKYRYNKIYFNNNCISIEAIEKPLSMYAKFSNSETKSALGIGAGTLQHIYTKYTNKKTSEILAEQNGYIFTPWGKGSVLFGLKWSCRDVLSEYQYTHITQEVFKKIKPASNNR